MTLLFLLMSVNALGASFGSLTLKRVKTTQSRLVNIHRSTSTENRSVVVFVQGIQIEDGIKWIRPFQLAKEHNLDTYFIKINNRNSLRKNMRKIKVSLISLYRRYPKRKIRIIAFSAGGAATLVAWKKLKKYQDRMYLTTVASPLAGYSAPSIALPFIGWIYGRYNRQMAKGFTKQLSDARYSQCEHYINIDCTKDRHSCPNDWTSNIQTLREMPCGWKKTKYFEETHGGILYQVVKELFPIL